jgi:predicted ester cyclase
VRMTAEPPDVVAVYEQYLAACNERRFDDLRNLVAADVSGSGPTDGIDAYVEGVAAIVRGFPDYRWDLQELVVQGDTVCARLTGRGTHTGTFSGVAATGRAVEVQELVVYRIRGGRIVHCWGDLFPVVRDALTATGGS